MNVTPILVSVLHTARQERRTPSSTTSKLMGMPYVVDSCRHAPVFERFRTAQSSFGALSLRMICAFFNTRLRKVDLFSCTGERLESTVV
jgi:hypothetical protein